MSNLIRTGCKTCHLRLAFHLYYNSNNEITEGANAEMKELDRKVRNLLNGAGAVYAGADVDRMCVSRETPYPNRVIMLFKTIQNNSILCR